MTDLLLSNDDLDDLRSGRSGSQTQAHAGEISLGRHKQRNHIAESEDGARFRVYLRQNLGDERDFSCGLALLHKGGKTPQPYPLQRLQPSTR